MGFLFFILFTIHLIVIELVNGDLVVLNFKASNQQNDLSLCALKKSYKSSNELSDQQINLINLDRYDACKEIVPVDPLTNKSALYIRIPKMSCQFSTVAKHLQANSPRLVIVGSDGPININSSNINLTAPYAFMPDEFALKLSNYLTGSNLYTVIVRNDLNRFDASLIVIWFIAVVTIILGALWTKLEFNTTLQKPIKSDEQTIANSNENLVNAQLNNSNSNSANLIDNQAKNIEEQKKQNSDKNIITLSVGYVSIFVLLLFVVGMLLLLYFFYNVMIYFVYAIFCIGSTSALYRVGSLALDKVNILSCQIPKNNLPYLKNHRPQISKILLLCASITLVVIWFVYRHEDWSWIIQNIMALALATNALSYYRLSTYKTVTIILVLFFLYDIFMVFITPQFTKGTSIMEAVAFGGKDASESTGPQDWTNLQFGPRKDTSNRLPVVIIIPHLSPTRRLCAYFYDFSFSLLGLGDILVPGLSVNYAIIFDRANLNKYYPYFIVNVFGYLIGLFLAFIGLLFMNTAQPALLYLCPVLLIFSFITALVRKETKLFWSGEPSCYFLIATKMFSTSEYPQKKLLNQRFFIKINKMISLATLEKSVQHLTQPVNENSISNEVNSPNEETNQQQVP